jgi:23S rRNA pseudouridine1911/1915/1917 synthase
MVARTERAYDSLVAQLAARTVSRRYLTVVEGIVEADEGLIDAPLGRSPRRATRRAVVPDGRPARTRYRVERRSKATNRTYLECRLETGRTHQIRAHMGAIGHPVLGDVQYDAAPVPELDRPFLHAAALAFTHPVTGQSIELSSALPSDLQAVLDAMDLAEEAEGAGDPGDRAFDGQDELPSSDDAR